MAERKNYFNSAIVRQGLDMNTTSREVKKSSSIQVRYQQAKRTEKSAAEQENQDPLWDQ